MLNLLKLYLLAILLAVFNPAISDPMTGQSYPPAETQKTESYGSIISTKLGSGSTNLMLSPLEIPKNIINTTNETNLALGVTGGVAKGLLHMAGRLLAGTVDTLTFFIPSEPLTNPPYIWQNFKKETIYNPLFKPKK